VGTSGSLVNTSGSLVDTSNSLVDTSNSLVGTSGVLDKVSKSLVDTSNVLVSAHGTAVAITGTLEDAQNPPDKLGAQNIWERVDVANGVLSQAKSDTGDIISELGRVNASLKSVCTKTRPSDPC